MPPKLKPLLLPRLVEERRRRESIRSDATELDLSYSTYMSQNSSASDISAPVTPTFPLSPRSHVRYSSSSSSLDLAMHIYAADNGPSSPSIAVGTTKSSKRSLPDLQEEPQEEQDEDFGMFDDYAYDCCVGVEHDDDTTLSVFELPVIHDLEYDLTESFFSDHERASPPGPKARKEAEFPLANGITTRLGHRFPSFSAKWRQRKASNPPLITESVRDLSRSRAGSRATSSRSSSLTGSFKYGEPEILFSHLPPTPSASIFNGISDESAVGAIDIEKANRKASDHDEALATTPLLPPLMMDANANTKPDLFQSPLQSPSVAETIDALPGNITPSERVTITGMPSPPLSNKASISSFHHVNGGRPGRLIPLSEIPPIHIADINDEWANKLGHANFTVQPEPYLPTTFDLDACRQLRADWDLARCNYTKHLVRTGEHYGVTSKTYALTEQKWAQVDAEWKRNNDATIANTVKNGGDAFCTLGSAHMGDGSGGGGGGGGSGGENVMTKIPSLNDPHSAGKFPQLGDEDIVGPMVQVAAQLQRTPSKKAKIFKFLSDKFSANLKRSLTS